MGKYIKEEAEEELHLVLRSKFEDDMVFTTLERNTSPSDPTLAITTGSRTTTCDLPYPTFHMSPLPHEQASNDETRSKEHYSILVTKPRYLLPITNHQIYKHPFSLSDKEEGKKDEDEKLLNIFKQIHINLPFLEAMIHMPKGAKVLKHLLSHKEKLEKATSSVKLNHGASINLMPYSLFRKIGISELKPTKMSIQLADHSLKYPTGVCENLLVKINKFIFLVDFVVLEIGEDESVLIILGCPFLAMAHAIIDVDDERMSLRVGKETVETNQNHEKAQEISFHPRHKVESLEKREPENCLKPSIKEPPKLELKELPKNLEKLNGATQKYNFPLTFIDQMLERLAGHEYYCFLDGFLGYFQILIAPEDQEKTIFSSPYGTFAYKRIPFGLCNALTTFQRCIMAIFYELIEESMEVLGALIEVDRAKIDSTGKLPQSTNVKAIKSFLGNKGFYQRFIKDLSQVARPLTQLLVKDAPFSFSEECVQVFEKLKHELTQAPIMIKPD
nr:DNA-directed DNA polymerase [Tanacetum cinerariifolium]